MVRQAERDDLETLAHAWGVSVSAAVWAIVADYLATLRGEAPYLGETKLDIQKSREIADRAR